MFALEIADPIAIAFTSAALGGLLTWSAYVGRTILKLSNQQTALAEIIRAVKEDVDRHERQLHDLDRDLARILARNNAKVEAK